MWAVERRTAHQPTCFMRSGRDVCSDEMSVRWLHQGVNGSGEARTWLLPLVRQHTRGAALAYWTANLLPAARACGQLAVAASKAVR